MKYTDNYNLNKPELPTYVNVNDLNENMDILDDVIKELRDDVDNLESTEVVKKVNRAGDTMTGVLKAQSNTSYSTMQVRNMILSPDNVNGSLMNNGEIWIKYGD